MADRVELMLADLAVTYREQDVSNEFLRLYDEDKRFGRMFASFHQRLNEHFRAINDRARSTKHYWADNSRDMIALLDEVREVINTLEGGGFSVALSTSYAEAMEACTPWLSSSGGSTIPDNFQQVSLVRWEPVFSFPETTISVKRSVVDLTMVGSGSYANVFRFVDPDYGVQYALKRAKRGLDPRDLHRFQQEFHILRRLSFPYLVEVYRYNDERNEYTMEYCDSTLRDLIRRRNSTMQFETRKRIALQFLFAMNYIHSEGLLHRDISLQNVLLKGYRSGAVVVKLSDFGLVKDRDSSFTRTSTDMRGTIRDPALDSFREYALPSEMYSIGHVLAWIFTGRESIRSDGSEVGSVVARCTDNDPSRR